MSADWRMRRALTVRRSGSPGPAPMRKTLWPATSDRLPVEEEVMGGPRWSGGRDRRGDRGWQFRCARRVGRKGWRAKNQWYGGTGNFAEFRRNADARESS